MKNSEQITPEEQIRNQSETIASLERKVESLERELQKHLDPDSGEFNPQWKPTKQKSKAQQYAEYQAHGGTMSMQEWEKDGRYDPGLSGQDDHFYIQRPVTLPKTSKLTEEVIQQLDHIFDYSSPEEYRNTLIEVYHVYMMHEYHSLPYEFERMASHLYFLIDFLKRAGEEMEGGLRDEE